MNPMLQSRPLLIGMLHVPPLPGSPRFTGDLAAVEKRVLQDAAALVEGGLDHLLLENFGDAPFFPHSVPPPTLTHLTALAVQIKNRFPVRLGINVLRNDGCGALSVAHAAGADFIRVNVLCGARVADQGLLSGIAHDLLRLRASLRAEHISILADVDVKHSAPLGKRPIADEVRDLIDRGGADAVIASGGATGQPVDVGHLQQIAAAAQTTPVLVGSGADSQNIAALLQIAAGAIVGTSLKRGGDVTQPVDVARVREFIAHIPAQTSRTL